MVTVSLPSLIVTVSLDADCWLVVTVTVEPLTSAVMLAVVVLAVYVPLPPLTVAVAVCPFTIDSDVGVTLSSSVTGGSSGCRNDSDAVCVFWV